MRWVEFSVSAPLKQSLWLTYYGGDGSQVRVNGKPVESLGKSTNDQWTMRLNLPQGEHAVQIKMVGSPQRVPLEVRLTNPWQPREFQ